MPLAAAWHDHLVRGVLSFLRSNPQALVLLLICLVLGVGTFLAVVLGLLSAGTNKTTGEPSGTLTSRLAADVIGSSRPPPFLLR